MARLNQIIAIEKGIKSRAYAELTELHKAAQKPDLFHGFVKTYQKRDEARCHSGSQMPQHLKCCM